MSVLVVTGTGTDVGKTIVTAALAALALGGPRGSVAVVKPAQTGLSTGEPGDLAEVTRLSGCDDTHEYARYRAALSPEAAARIGSDPELGLDEVAGRIGELDAARDLVIVEGAGGLLVRFAEQGWTIADLAAALQAPLVVVTAAGLGTLNHTALTLEAIEARGLELAGLVIGSWPAEPGVAELSNVADLRALNRRRFAGAVPAGASRMKDFSARARAWLAPEFGGTFDGTSFARSAQSALSSVLGAEQEEQS